ncbi:MAG: TAXI family TRAP transporter solute-binding subunit [Acidilobaceae archaeon]
MEGDLIMPVSKTFWYSVAAVILLLILIVGYFTVLKPTPTPSTPTYTPSIEASPTPTPSPTPTRTTTPAPSKYSIVITTGGIGGVFFYYGGAVAAIVSNFTDIPASTVNTAGSVDNLLLIRDKTDLAKGVVYCALVLPDSAYLAYTGQHDKFKDKPAPIAILWAMYPNYLHIVTTADSGIKSLLDLKGKRVSTGAPGSGTEVEALLVLELVGINPARDFAKWERLGAAEAAAALRDGTLDAYFFTGKVIGSVVELSKVLAARGKQIYIVPLSDTVINAFTTLYPGLAVRGVISKEWYGAPEDAPTLAFWALFVCHKDTPDDVAYKITKVVFENLDFLRKAVAAARDTTLENALMFIDGAVPYHEGALKYFKEKGRS